MSQKKKAVPTFAKQQFLQSEHFSPVERDVLRALMKDDERLTLDQARKRIEEFAKRKVK